MNALRKLLDYYENVERLVAKLPKPLQQPILREIQPIKDLFLKQRPARLGFLGDEAVDLHGVVQALFGSPVKASRAAELEFVSDAGARLHVIDARRPEVPRPEGDADLWIVLVANNSDQQIDLDAVARVVSADGKNAGSVIGVVVTDGADAEPQRVALHSALRSEPAVRDRFAASLAVCPLVRFRPDGSLDAGNDRREGIDELAQVITRELPPEAKLEMARLSKVKSVQAELADKVVKSVSVIAGAIGTQPIPLADFPILTTLQAGTVAAVMYISGRPVNMKLGAEFVAALGANVGLGLVLREGSRAALKFLPGWGNAVSGGIAGAGTYAIGRAATAYFIERRSMEEARRVFKRKRKELPLGK